MRWNAAQAAKKHCLRNLWKYEPARPRFQDKWTYEFRESLSSPTEAGSPLIEMYPARVRVHDNPLRAQQGIIVTSANLIFRKARRVLIMEQG
jgi:hypothetical protein